MEHQNRRWVPYCKHLPFHVTSSLLRVTNSTTRVLYFLRSVVHVPCHEKYCPKIHSLFKKCTLRKTVYTSEKSVHFFCKVQTFDKSVHFWEKVYTLQKKCTLLKEAYTFFRTVHCFFKCTLFKKAAYFRTVLSVTRITEHGPRTARNTEHGSSNS